MFEPVASNRGTKLILENLFFKNKIKNQQSSVKLCLGNIEDLVKSFSCFFSQCRFAFRVNNRAVFTSLQENSRQNNILNAFPEIKKSGIFETEKKVDQCFELRFFCTKPNDELSFQKTIVFVNGRLVKHKEISKAITNAYKTSFLSINKKCEHYFVFLDVKLSLKHIDFNISADKYEVKIMDESYLIKELEDHLLNELRERMNIKSYVNKVTKFNYFHRDQLSDPLKSKNDTPKNDKYQLRSNPFRTSLEEFYKSTNSNRFSGPRVQIYNNDDDKNDHLNKREDEQSIKNLDNYGDDLKIQNSELSDPQTLLEEEKPKRIRNEDLLKHEEPKLFVINHQKTSEVLINAEFLGCVDPFNILIQKDHLLILFETFNLLTKYLENEIKQLIMNAEYPSIFELFQIKDFPFDFDFFQSYCLKCDINSEESFQTLKKNIDQLQQIMPKCFDISFDLKFIKIPIPPFLINHVDSESIHFFLFRIAKMKENLSVSNYPDALTKFIVFVINTQKDSFGTNLKKNFDNFYSRIFSELKRKTFGYDFKSKDEIQEILDIKNSYKYFERC